MCLNGFSFMSWSSSLWVGTGGFFTREKIEVQMESSDVSMESGQGGCLNQDLVFTLFNQTLYSVYFHNSSNPKPRQWDKSLKKYIHVNYAGTIQLLC